MWHLVVPAHRGVRFFLASLIDCMVLSYSVLISAKQCRTRSFPGDILHDMRNAIFGFNQGGIERGMEMGMALQLDFCLIASWHLLLYFRIRQIGLKFDVSDLPSTSKVEPFVRYPPPNFYSFVTTVFITVYFTDLYDVTIWKVIIHFHNIKLQSNGSCRLLDRRNRNSYGKTQLTIFHLTGL